MKKFGILMQGLEMTRLGKVPTIVIGFLSIARQITLSIGIVCFRDQPVFLIFLYNTTSLIMALVKLNFKPFKDRKTQWIQIFQEITIIIISYLLICFTSYVEPVAAASVGDLTTLIIIAQMLVFFVIGIQHVLYRAKLQYSRYRYRKQ